jgi:hypothetical protein
MIKYSTPEMDLVVVATADVITASPTNKGEFDDEEV